MKIIRNFFILLILLFFFVNFITADELDFEDALSVTLKMTDPEDGDKCVLKDFIVIEDDKYFFVGELHKKMGNKGYARYVYSDLYTPFSTVFSAAPPQSADFNKAFEMDTSIIVFGMEYNDKDPDEQFSSRTPRIYKFNKLASHQNDKSIFPKKGYTLINIDRMNKEDFILCYKRYENNRFVYGAAIVDANAKLKKQKDFTQMAIDNIKFVDSENIFLTGITVDNENGYFNIFKITENFDITAENSIKYAAANKIGFVNYGIFNINENTFVTFINARNDKFQEICVAIVFDNQCNIIDKIEMPKLDIKQPYEKIKSIIQIEPTIFLFSGYLGDIINAKAFIRLISLDGKTISVKYSKNPNNTYINYCAVKNKNDEIITIGTQAKINNSPVDVNIVNYGKLKYPKPKEYKVSKILKPVSSGNISVSSQPSEKSADLMQTTKTTSYQSSKDESDEPYYLTDENNKVYEALILNSKYDSLLKIKKIFQRRNSNYVLLAEIMNGPNREPGIDGLMLIELDKNYKIIWRENIFSLEQYNYELLSCFENNNNELFVITNAIKTKTINDKTVYFSKVEILKVDKGAIISRNEINFSNNIWCFGAYKIKENELILLLVDNENPTAKKYFAVKTDFVGKIISKKILSNSENHTKSIIDKNNGIFTVGVNFDKKTVSFAKYNAAAGLEWAKEYPQSNFLVKDIIQTENGNYIIAGIEQTLSYSKIALFILDANGNLVKYENAYQPFKDNYCNVFQILKLENDNYLILGSIDAKTAEKVFNMAINANGIPLYHKVEEKPEAHYTPNSMLIDNDKNLIIAGITKTKNESWFAKFTKIKEYIFIRNFGDINSNVAKYQEKTKLRDLKRRESLQPKSEAETKKSDEQKEYQPSELKKRERRR